MRRLALLLSLALLSLAFAPAPLPRRQARARDTLEVSRLVGAWRISGRNAGISHVVITPTQWTFGKPGRITYDLRVHHDKQPAEFDLMRVGQKEPYGRGIIKREGDTIRIAYKWSNGRPARFDEPGNIVMTLERE